METLTVLLDRYLFTRYLAMVALVDLLAATLVTAMNEVINLHLLLRGDLPPGASRAALVVQHALWQVPVYASLLLPMAAMIGAAMLLIPRLRRGSFQALVAAGISLRRCARPLLAAALVIGATDLALRDRVVPDAQVRFQAIESVLRNRNPSSRAWYDDAGRTAWFSQVALLNRDEPSLHGVVAAPADGGLVRADAMLWRDGRWLLDGTVLRAPTGLETVSVSPSLDAAAAGAPPADPPALRRLLRDRQAMSCRELWMRGQRADRSEAAGRLTALAAPLLALALMLTSFLHLHHAERPLGPAIRAGLLGLVPLLLLGLADWAADANPGPPELTLALGLALAGLVAGIAWHRWRA